MNGNNLLLEPENNCCRVEGCGQHRSKTLHRQVQVEPLRRLTPMAPMPCELNSSKRVRPS